MNKKRKRGVDVPHDVVLLNILTRLPVRTLLRFRCVSKLWRASMADPRFVAAHLEASRASRPGSATVDVRAQNLLFMDSDGVVTLELTLPPEMGLLGSDFTWLQSCNGLLLVGTTTRMLVCNPATGRVITLPEFTIKDAPCWLGRRRGIDPPVLSDSLCSLGFDPSSQRYKVLHMALAGEHYDCEILTLVGDHPPPWRKIGRSPRLVGTFLHSFLDGVLYWMPPANPDDNRTTHLMSFDLRVEKFGLFPLPKRLTLDDVDVMSVAVLQGRLCISEAQSCFPQDRKVLHLWVLVEPSKRKRGWYSEYITPPFDFEEIIYAAAIHRGDVLVSEPGRRSYYYSLHDGTVKMLLDGRIISPLGPVVDHVESLVWPLQLN